MIPNLALLLLPCPLLAQPTRAAFPRVRSVHHEDLLHHGVPDVEPTSSSVKLLGSFDVNWANLAIVGDRVALRGGELTHGHPALELLALGLAALHLHIEVPLLALAALLHLQVEGHVLKLQQAWPPEGIAVLVVQSACIFNLFLIRKRLCHIIVPTLGIDDMIGEVCEGSLLVTCPVRTSHLTESTSLLMPMDCVDVTSLRAACISPVARMLYPLDYRGCHLTDTVGHGDPAGGTDVHLVLALVADDMAVAAAGHWGCSWDGEAHWTLHALLQLLQKPLRLHSLGDDFSLPLPENCLQARQADRLLVQNLT